MADPIIRDLEAGDIEAVADNLRQADREEMQALHGADADMRAILAESVQVTDQPRVMVVDGVPVGIFGCAPVGHLKATGAPWFLATDAVTQHPKFLVEQGRIMVSEWHQRYARLLNIVDARNVRSIRWLKAVGFAFKPAITLGDQGLPFHPFEHV